VIDTLAVADADAPKGQPDSRRPEGAAPTPDGPLAAGRIVGAVALFVVAAVVVITMFVLKSDSVAINVLLVGVAAILTGLASVVLPIQLRNRFVPFVVVAAGTAGLLATVLAIPSLSPTPKSSSDASNSVSPPPTTSPPPSTTTSEQDPFTANLKFGPRESTCEGFTLNKKLLRAMPKPKDVKAEWVYKNGGATRFGTIILTIQGKSQFTVVIDALRVVDLERHPAPPHVAEVLPCDPEGGLQAVRYFDVDLSKRPKVIPRPSDPLPPEDKRQPAAKFPFKVSRSDPEVFELWVDGPECLCAWRLAVDWTSGGQSRTTFLDHGFDKIKTNTKQGLPGYYYDSDSGWVPPLPK
jgi:hypothetical protein